MNIDINDLQNIVIEGIASNDYPRFTDAFVAYAEWKENSDELLDDQLEWITDNLQEDVQRLAYESLL